MSFGVPEEWVDDVPAATAPTANHAPRLCARRSDRRGKAELERKNVRIAIQFGIGYLRVIIASEESYLKSGFRKPGSRILRSACFVQRRACAQRHYAVAKCRASDLWNNWFSSRLGQDPRQPQHQGFVQHRNDAKRTFG